uniref:glucuronosyltransferase n=1 Tax=Pristionchus pacificus TaxID=54126 RepID=A0A8R1Z532_PRIPA
MLLGSNHPSCKISVLGTDLPIRDEIRDLGVTYINRLCFTNHINDIIGKASARCAFIYRSFQLQSITIFPKLFSTYVRPLLEYFNELWNPCTVTHIARIEKVQRRFSLIVFSRCGLPPSPNHDRLKIMNLPSLYERRTRIDLLTSYKIIFGHFDLNCRTFFNFSPRLGRSRGHRLKLSPFRTSSNRYCSFLPNRIIVFWNSLDDSIFSNSSPANMFEMNNFNPIGEYFICKIYKDVFAAQCRALLDEPGARSEAQASFDLEAQFDVLLTAHFDPCGVGLVELIKPRSLISVSTTIRIGPEFEEFGLPQALSHDPVISKELAEKNHSSLRLQDERSLDVGSLTFTEIGLLVFVPKRHSVSPHFANSCTVQGEVRPEFPIASGIVFQNKYPQILPTFLINSERFIDYAVPTITKVIAIGGTGAKEPGKLSEDWLKILSKRAKTVLDGFRFYGQVRLPPSGKCAILIISPPYTLAIRPAKCVYGESLPDVTFIWKYELDDDFTRNQASKSENLELTKWMPQADLLAHPNLSLFVTHGGIGSVQETALRGVTAIFIPIFGDQPRNAGIMEHNKFGKVLDKTEVTNSAKFLSVIREVLQDESDVTASENKYTEFAAEFGPSKAFRPQSHDMNWIEYHNDIIVTGISFILLFTIIALIFAQRILRRFIGIFKKKTD